jgi:hypothetical protein
VIIPLIILPGNLNTTIAHGEKTTGVVPARKTTILIQVVRHGIIAMGAVTTLALGEILT